MDVCTLTFGASEQLNTTGIVLTGSMKVTLWPDIPQLEIQTEGGKVCVLKGEDFGKFIRWITEQGYHVA